MLSPGIGNAPSALIHEALDPFLPPTCWVPLCLRSPTILFREVSLLTSSHLHAPVVGWMVTRRSSTCCRQMGEWVLLGRGLASWEGYSSRPLSFSMSQWFRVSFLTGLGRVEGKSELFLIPVGQPLQVLKLVWLLPLNPDGFRISLLSCLCLFFFSPSEK